MIIFHSPDERGVDCTDLGHCHAFMRKAVWIDLLNPTEQEEIIMDSAFSIELPAREDMHDIELSRRFYRVDHALFMTATILTKSGSDQPESNVVTFIMVDHQLITLRYTDPLPFATFRAEREADLASYGTAPRIFEGLVSAVIERVADLLENAGATLDQISRDIFAPSEPASAKPKAAAKPRDLEQVLLRLGRCSDLLSRIRESLSSLGRMLSYFTAAQKDIPPDLAQHLHTMSRDLQPLGDHASFLAQKVSYLQDATLGLINIEQNAIIKVFTVAAVLFLPPTVVGTIYGMNFETMPELKWAMGYPLAIFLMILSAVVPYLYFRRRKWF